MNNKKALAVNTLIVVFFLLAHPVFADSSDVTKIQNFIQSIVQILVTLAGFVAAAFFVVGGFRYITSTGNPEHLEGAKKTIVYSALGLAISIGAFVLTNIVTDLATQAFGK